LGKCFVATPKPKRLSVFNGVALGGPFLEPYFYVNNKIRSRSFKGSEKKH
jgi:hypothetical protein